MKGSGLDGSYEIPVIFGRKPVNEHTLWRAFSDFYFDWIKSNRAQRRGCFQTYCQLAAITAFNEAW